jgi:very-short-patch-repair endonuclease
MAGWAPAYGEDRRKDYSRAAARARVLRGNETPHEKTLWKLLRQLNREGANFRRQAHVAHRVFDFADLGRKLLIELDGAVHEFERVREADKEKEIDAILRGYRVLRITNDELRVDPGAVVRRVSAAVAARPSSHREEGRVEGRPTGRSARQVRFGGASPAAPHPERPLPPTPPQGEGSE